jgi:hypothetical protein
MLPRVKEQYVKEIQQPALPVYMPNGVSLTVNDQTVLNANIVSPDPINSLLQPGSICSVNNVGQPPLSVNIASPSHHNVNIISSTAPPIAVHDTALLNAILSLKTYPTLNFLAFFRVQFTGSFRFADHLSDARYTYLLGGANETIFQTLLRHGYVDDKANFLVPTKLQLSASWSGWKASLGEDYATTVSVPVGYSHGGQHGEATTIALPCNVGTKIADCCHEVVGLFIRNVVDLSYTSSTGTMSFTFSRM